MKKNKKFENPLERNQLALSWAIRIFLIISVSIEIYYERWGIFLINFLVLLVTFLPELIKKILSISFPAKFKIIFLIGLLFSVFLEKLLGGLILQFFLGMFLGFIGFVLMFILYSDSKVRTSYSLVALFSFCFSVSLGAVWEVFRYFLTILFDLRIGNFNINSTSWGLFFTIIGAFIASTAGYLFIKHEKRDLPNRLIAAFKRKNPKLFTGYENTPEHILDLIKNGESETLEFKSTLRINLHTKQPDKKVEHAVIKTIVAFLNSDGGTLLVGVSDKGGILGIEKDGFQNRDMFYRHFTNLIKNNIGNEYLPYIKSKLILINNVNILKIDCVKCKKEVFFKNEDVEEFYVRAGPSSIKLKGSKLISYVNQRYKKD